MSQGGKVWRDGGLVSTYLKGVRAGIPLAKEQIEVMCRVIESLTDGVNRFLDLGCGDGILSAALLERFPGASGVLVDHSRPMLEAAQRRFAERGGRVEIVEGDLSRKGWLTGLEDGGFDAVVSGFCIHHLTDRRKQALYKEVFGLLKPGGMFVNVEHVASPSAELEEVFNQALVDSIYQKQVADRTGKTREDVAREYVYRPDKAANILAQVDRQCRWLERIGFEQVDCFFKYFELAVFGGKKSWRVD
ncbi:MAG: class I SAM-dependent methyltransferase [bacterium]|nr:class I SAM-dependent methyltransferase [bacterium]